METIQHREDYIEEPPGGRNLTRECADLIKLNNKIQMKHKKVEKMLNELLQKKRGARAVMKKLNDGNGNKRPDNNTRQCYRCEDTPDTKGQQCLAIGVERFNCNKRGHFSKVCKS